MANSLPFERGIQNTVLMTNNSGFSYAGTWKQAYTDTLVERWHIGDFSSAEFTISADFDDTKKELLKCLVTCGQNIANVVIYARSNVGEDLLNVTVTVNNSYVDLKVSPADQIYNGTKFIYTASYFANLNSLTP
tara:strand:+ start:26010 stop:26411 length:402 start_codon:yes stop_codon:yes gene_type:complete